MELLYQTIHSQFQIKVGRWDSGFRSLNPHICIFNTDKKMSTDSKLGAFMTNYAAELYSFHKNTARCVKYTVHGLAVVVGFISSLEISQRFKIYKKVKTAAEFLHCGLVLCPVVWFVWTSLLCAAWSPGCSVQSMQCRLRFINLQIIRTKHF